MKAYNDNLLIEERPAPVSLRRLIDGCGRQIDSLRLGVTSECDLRCVYCRPAVNGKTKADAASAGKARPTRIDLSDQQRVEFVQFLHNRYSLTQVRITGGEPLLYSGVVSLVARIRRAIPDITIAMTTNGTQLYDKGPDLKKAGLNRLNVSLDSLDPVVYHKITGSRIDEVLRGLDCAEFLEFRPLKINTVVLKGVNDGQIVELTRWALARGFEIRFLEAMPIGPAARVNQKAFVSATEIREKLARSFSLKQLPRTGGETATCYHASSRGHSGKVGIISPVTEPFCTSCRRIRLTASGRLYPCLLDGRSCDMTAAWQGDRFLSDQADELLQTAVKGKQPSGTRQQSPMITLGG